MGAGPGQESLQCTELVSCTDVTPRLHVINVTSVPSTSKSKFVFTDFQYKKGYWQTNLEGTKLGEIRFYFTDCQCVCH